MKAIKLAAAILLTAFLAVAGAPFALAAPMTMVTQPNTVEVGVNFSGSQLKVSGQVPSGSQMLIKMEAPERTVGLSKQGKKGGLFYMTVATVNVKGTPGMYKVWSSEKISSLSPALQKQMGVDPQFTAIRNNAQVIQKQEDRSVVLSPAQSQEYLAGLVRLNTKRGLYSMSDNSVQVAGGRYQATLDIPADVPRGDSKITAYAVKDGKIIATSSTKLPVVNIGLVKTLGNMAQTNAVAYGALCIVVALAAGIAIAGLFRLINKYIFKDDGVSAQH